MTATPLDVWGIGYGRLRQIAAVKSRAEFARLLGPGWNDRLVRVYGAVTGNPEELAIARSAPGVLFTTPNDYSGSPFTRRDTGARVTTYRDADGLHVVGLHDFKD